MTALSQFPITRKWPASHPDRLQLYSLPTPNGVKVSIMLEETGLPYEVHRVAFDTQDQFSPEFVSLNPYSKIPAIVDPGGPGGKFLPASDRGKYIALQWLMFQMGGVGPMFGQAHHFLRAAPEQVPYGIKRYTDETRRLYGVLDKRLSEAAYLADEYSIADIATFPWIARHEWHKVDLAEFPNVKRWYDTINRRPAVVRGMAVPTPP